MASTTTASALALHGGPKAKTTPYGTVQRFGDAELDYLRQALEQNTLFYGYGTFVKRACEAMARYTGMPHVVACSSGSAAIHLGLVACGIGPGDEVITTPNTDQGSVLGVIEEGAVPVFCDPEYTLQPSAAAIEARITARTRAVLVVHLAGYPAPMPEIVALCRRRGLGLVEDCAQSWGTRLHGQMVGSFGDAGAFSTNDFKHISTGDGGFVTLRDPALYRRVSNYSDKCYDRLFDRSQDRAHHAINYRMSELQGAVALAQLEKVDAITARYHAIGERLRAGLADLPGARMVAPIEGGHATYWWTLLLLDPRRLSASRDQIVQAMQAEGLNVGSHARYDLIQRPMFQHRILRPWLGDARRHYPLIQPDGRSYVYRLEDYPRHKHMLDHGITVAIGAGYSDQDVDETAAGIRKVMEAYQR